MTAAPSCRACQRVTRMGTCSEPQRAGLADCFVITWPPAGHADECDGFEARPPSDPPAPGPFYVVVSDGRPLPLDHRSN